MERGGDLILRAGLEPETTVLRASPGEEVRLPVRVTNESSVAFGSGNLEVAVSYRLLSVDGHRLEGEAPRVPIAEPLGPHDMRLVELPVRAPDRAGLYFVEVDLLCGVGWLSERGNPTGIVKLLAGGEIHATRWWLQVHEGSRAGLLELPGQPGTVRVAIAKTGECPSWQIQLNRLRFSVRAGRRYAVSFRARADRSRWIGVGFSRAHRPWDGLGWYQSIELTPVWRSFAEEFVATESESNARLHFDVGGADAAVELSGVRFQRPPEESAAEAPVYALPARLQMDSGTRPLSPEWGTERGFPLHRYYLEQFLTEFATDIRGHCLEFQNAAYTRRFGGAAVAALDILHIDDSNPLATRVADLTKPNDLPADYFDCIICTHVLQLIFEVGAAVSELHRILKPGGVLLVAEPHVSMCGSCYHEIWRFTPEGMEALLGKAFGAGNVTVRAYGSSLTAAGELRGLVVDEFTTAELAAQDPRFPVEVCARASKSR